MRVYIASYRYMLDDGESGGAILGVYQKEEDAIKAVEIDKQEWIVNTNNSEDGWVSDFNFDDGEDWCDWEVIGKEVK